MDPMSKTIETTYRNGCIQLPDGVHLAEAELRRGQVRLGREDDMLLPVNLAGLVPDLLPPDQAVVMAVPGRNDVGQAVAVHVIDQHLRAGLGKVEGMERPRLVQHQVRRLLPPAEGFDDVHAFVAVDITEADAVREFLKALVLAGDRVKHPRLVGLGGIGHRVAEVAVLAED